MAVVAIGGDDLIAFLERHLHADHDRFLADIEMAEAADQTHAVELAGLLLETADQEHLAECADFLLAVEHQCQTGLALAVAGGTGRRFLGLRGLRGDGHGVPRSSAVNCLA